METVAQGFNESVGGKKGQKVEIEEMRNEIYSFQLAMKIKGYKIFRSYKELFR